MDPEWRQRHRRFMGALLLLSSFTNILNTLGCHGVYCLEVHISPQTQALRKLFWNSAPKTVLKTYFDPDKFCSGVLSFSLLKFYLICSEVQTKIKLLLIIQWRVAKGWSLHELTPFPCFRKSGENKLMAVSTWEIGTKCPKDLNSDHIFFPFLFPF